MDRHGYQIDGYSFRAWSHWITPRWENKRFDTRFLVALLPDGQHAVDRGIESDHSSWFTPAAALAGAVGAMPMLPTTDALSQLAGFPTARDAFDAAADRSPRPAAAAVPRTLRVRSRASGGRLLRRTDRAPVTLPFIGSTGPWASGPVLPTAEVVLAPNPSPMTLDGTNTWVLGNWALLRSSSIPDRPTTGTWRPRTTLERRDQRPAVILLTHGHDHLEGARLFAETLGVAVRALDPAHRYGTEGLTAGDRVSVGSVELVRRGHFFGHSSDSLSFHLSRGGRC